MLSCNQAPGDVFGFADVVGKRFPTLFNGASDLASSAIERARRDGAASFRWTRSERCAFVERRERDDAPRVGDERQPALHRHAQ